MDIERANFIKKVAVLSTVSFLAITALNNTVITSTDAIEAYDELSQSIASSETEKVAEILKPSLLTIKNSTLTDEQKTTMFQSIVDYIATNNIEPKTPADRAEFVMAMIFLSNYSSKADDYLENKSW